MTADLRGGEDSMIHSRAIVPLRRPALVVVCFGLASKPKEFKVRSAR